MRKLYQLDTTNRQPILIYEFDAPMTSLPFYCVEVSPIETTDGKVLWWETELDPVADSDYGKTGTGYWELKDDNRAEELFLTIDGSKYSIGAESDNGVFDGIGKVPNWLTLKERPSLYHSWNGSDWEVTPESEEKRLVDLATAVRQQRDALLTQSDWTQLEDSPLKDDTAWLNYRQALRDITEQPGFPEEIIWPKAPNK